MTDYLFTEEDIRLINAVFLALDNHENHDRVRAVTEEALRAWTRQRTVAISLTEDD